MEGVFHYTRPLSLSRKNPSIPKLIRMMSSFSSVMSLPGSATVDGCSQHTFTPGHLKVRHHLEFLQEGLDKGLCNATPRRQVSPSHLFLATPKAHALWITPTWGSSSVGQHYPTFPRSPSWGLSLVLRSLTRPPFEPLLPALSGYWPTSWPSS